MSRKAKPKTDEDIYTARQVIRGFKDPPSAMAREDQIKLVSIYYKNIRGVSLDNVPKNQLYKIAIKLYNNAQKISKIPTTYEGGLLQEILRLDDLQKSRISLENEILRLDEGICKRLENLPQDHELIRTYDKMKKT